MTNIPLPHRGRGEGEGAVSDLIHRSYKEALMRMPVVAGNNPGPRLKRPSGKTPSRRPSFSRRRAVRVAVMPDAHKGYGMPIGCMLATDRAIVPYAVGVDIGCGMIAARTTLDLSDVTPERVRDALERVYRRVPVGQLDHRITGPDLYVGHRHFGTGLGGQVFVDGPGRRIGVLHVPRHPG